MNAEKYQQRIEEMYDDGTIAKTLMGLDHTEKKHCGKKSSEMIERIISRGKNADSVNTNSSFYTEEIMYDNIAESILADAENIIRWYQYADVHERYVGSVVSDHDPIGNGFYIKNGKIKEFRTNCTTFILEKNPSWNELGLQLITAYPDNEPDKLPARQQQFFRTSESCHNLIQAMRETPTYQNAGRVERIYLENMVNPDTIPCSYAEIGHTNEPCLFVNAISKSSGIVNTVKISDTETTFSRKDKDRKIIDLSDIRQKFDIPDHDNYISISRNCVGNKAFRKALSKKYPEMMQTVDALKKKVSTRPNTQSGRNVTFDIKNTDLTDEQQMDYD